MRGLFSLLPGVNTPILYPANWHYAKEGIRRNLIKVIDFYQSHSMSVASSHFLIRLLESINIDKSQDLWRYYNLVDALSLNLGMALKMTSPISKGHMFDGIFYKDCREVLIAENAEFDVNLVNKDWQNAQSVRVLRHPFTDLELNLPDGKKHSDENGICVITINIPMLAIQYRAFRLEEDMYIARTGQPGRTIQEFIHMYVLPNMLYSHLDYVMFNRIFCLERGIKMGSATKMHPFYITDFTQKVNAVQSTVLVNLQSIGQDFYRHFA